MPSNDRGRRWAAGGRRGVLLGGVLLGLAWVMAGCGVLPPAFQSAFQWQPMVDPVGVVARFREVQAERVQALGHWQAEGVLDIDVAGKGRRVRVRLVGAGLLEAGMTIEGPFRQVVAEMVMDPEWIRMSDPSRREVVEVPADEEGMHFLTGVALRPSHLVMALLGGYALEVVAGQLPGGGDRVTVVSEEGEQWVRAAAQEGGELRIAAVGARLREYSGTTSAGVVYRVVYEWGEGSPRMPSEVRITLGTDSQVMLRVSKWRIGMPVRAAGFSTVTGHEGFTRVRPLAH